MSVAKLSKKDVQSVLGEHRDDFAKLGFEISKSGTSIVYQCWVVKVVASKYGYDKEHGGLNFFFRMERKGAERDEWGNLKNMINDELDFSLRIVDKHIRNKLRSIADTKEYVPYFSALDDEQLEVTLRILMPVLAGFIDDRN